MPSASVYACVAYSHHWRYDGATWDDFRLFGLDLGRKSYYRTDGITHLQWNPSDIDCPRIILRLEKWRRVFNKNRIISTLRFHLDSFFASSPTTNRTLAKVMKSCRTIFSTKEDYLQV